MGQINNDFWLEFAKERASQSIKSRENAADKLDTFLQWIWGIYIGIFALASFFDAISSNIWLMICVVQPILVLMIARYFCHRVSMPNIVKEGKFTTPVDDVQNIIDTFKLIVEDKKKKMIVARFLTLISILSLMISLVGYNYCNPEKTLKQQIKIAALEKELYLNRSALPKKQSVINDSINLVNLYLDAQIQHIIKQKMLECIQNGNKKCIDSITKLPQ